MLFWDPSFSLALACGAAILLVAALFRIVPGAPRARLRRSVLLFVVYLLVAGTRVLVGSRAGATLAEGLRFADALFGVLLAVDLGALVAFDLVLRLVRWRVSDILR